MVGNKRRPSQQAADDRLHPPHVGNVGDESTSFKERVQRIQLKGEDCRRCGSDPRSSPGDDVSQYADGSRRNKNPQG